MELKDDDDYGEKDALDNSQHSVGAMFTSMFGASPGTLVGKKKMAE
jgi:hypothetical protein